MADSEGESKPSAVNLPNALTLLRLVLVPVFVWLMFLDGVWMRWLALAVFLVASITDHLDGRIARARGLITEFGMLADPIADKALTLGAFIACSIQGSLPWWFTGLVAIREVGITAMREVLRRQGNVIPAGSGGKLKTVLQMTLIVWLLVPWPTFMPASWLTGISVLAWVLVAVTLVQTIVSAVPYLWGVWKWRQEQAAGQGQTPAQAHGQTQPQPQEQTPHSESANE